MRLFQLSWVSRIESSLNFIYGTSCLLCSPFNVPEFFVSWPYCLKACFSCRWNQFLQYVHPTDRISSMRMPRVADRSARAGINSGIEFLQSNPQHFISRNLTVEGSLYAQVNILPVFCSTVEQVTALGGPVWFDSRQTAFNSCIDTTSRPTTSVE
jgi:hypothetical protein